MSRVSVKNLTRRAGGKAILDDACLEVENGEILAVIGPSGAGKTTLLRVINMLDRPDSGTVTIDGKDIMSSYGDMALRRSMALVFQKSSVFHMSVYDNIAYGLRLRKHDKQDIERRVSYVMKLLHLEGKERRSARSLSGGEMQRVSFARAYVLEPKLLLLDEPTANLDPSNGAIIEDSIRHINQTYGTTVILVTHNMYQAKRLAHRVSFMADGQLIETGSIEEIFKDPRDPRTKAFTTGATVY